MELQDTGFVKLFQKRIRISVVKLLKLKLDELWVRSWKVPQFYKEMMQWFE